MKITVKQLKQLIREQVEMAMHEDETVFMPQASEEVKKAVETINASDALAKNWAKRNLKLENAKRRLRRLHENEEQMPAKQEILAAAKGMTPEEAKEILDQAGIDVEDIANNPKVQNLTDKAANYIIKSGKLSSETGMDEKYDPKKMPHIMNLSGQLGAYAMATVAAAASAGPGWGNFTAVTAAAIAVTAAAIAFDKAIEKYESDTGKNFWGYQARGFRSGYVPGEASFGNVIRHIRKTGT